MASPSGDSRRRYSTTSEIGTGHESAVFGLHATHAAPDATPHTEAPSIDVLTFGVGARIFEKFGRAAICLRYANPEHPTVCFNYGVTAFDAGAEIAWNFLRREQKFWLEPETWSLKSCWSALTPPTWTLARGPANPGSSRRSRTTSALAAADSPSLRGVAAIRTLPPPPDAAGATRATPGSPASA